MLTISFAKIGQLVPQFQSRKRSKWTAWWSRKTTVFVLSVATKETVLMNAGHITHVTALSKIYMLQTDQQNVRRRAIRSKYQDTVHPLNLSDFCNNTYYHSVVLVVVFVVVVDFIFTTTTTSAATTSTTTADVESELHKLLPCNTMCKAAPWRSDVTVLQHVHGFFYKRKMKGRRKEGMTKDNTRHTGKRELKRAKEK